MLDDLPPKNGPLDLDGTNPLPAKAGWGMEQQIAGLFDRYAEALDAGDVEVAEEILAELPACGEGYRTPLRGLYLLGRAARQGNAGPWPQDRIRHGRLGDFEIDGELGRGGMGIVYSATECALLRRVALKVLPFAAVADPRSVARFRNEARSAAALHHPNIVPVYAIGCERGVHYYSMQLVDGQSLEKFIVACRDNPSAERGPVATKRPRGSDEVRPPVEGSPLAAGETINVNTTVASVRTPHYIRKAMEIGRDVAKALAHAHAQGVVHRDIKPSNLLLDNDGKIWVTDFGLARLGDSAGLTSQGDRPGTARYMSPEQAAGQHQRVDFRTDIYSLGVTLFELLTGTPAFDAPDRNGLLAAIEAGCSRALRSVNPRVPFDLETVVVKAMATEPADRYQSADEFADDLQRCLDGDPVQARRPSLLDRTLRTVQKNQRTFLGLALASLATGILGVSAASVFLAQRQKATVAGDQARLFLAQAHRVVDRFGVLLADDLEHVPGAEVLRKDLLAEAIQYQRGFADFAAQDPALNRERGLALSRLAGLYLRCDREAEAEASCRAALALLAKEDLSDVDGRECAMEIAVCHCRLGNLGLRTGDLDAACREFRDAIDETGRLKAGSGDPELASVAVQSRAGLALVEWKRERRSVAIGLMEAALESVRSEFGSVPENDELRSVLFRLDGQFAGLLAEFNPALARERLERSLASLEQSFAPLETQPGAIDPIALADGKTPETEQLQQLVRENRDHAADLRNNLSIVLGRTGDLEPAAVEADKVISYWRSRFAGQPESAWLARRLATAENTLGEIRCRQSRWTDAEESFGRAESLLRDMARKHPEHPETLSRLAGVLHNRCVAGTGLGESGNARHLMLEAIQCQTRACELAPAQAEYRARLESHRGALDRLAATTAPLVTID